MAFGRSTAQVYRRTLSFRLCTAKRKVVAVLHRQHAAEFTDKLRVVQRAVNRCPLPFSQSAGIDLVVARIFQNRHYLTLG